MEKQRLLAQQSFSEVMQPTGFEGLSFLVSAEGLKGLDGRGGGISPTEGYPFMLRQLFAEKQIADRFEKIVFESSDQITPIVENTILPADAFIIPFENTNALRSFASIYKMLVKYRSNTGLTCCMC